METQLSPAKKGYSPQFSAYVYCGQTVVRIKMKLGMQVGHGPGHIVLNGDPAPLATKGHSPQFSAHVYCGQTAGCNKMPLDMEVGLSPGDFVLDGDPAPSAKRGGAPTFSLRLLWPNGCMDQDATWYGGTPWFMRHCVRWGPISLPVKGHSPPIFGQCPLWPYGWMD